MPNENPPIFEYYHVWTDSEGTSHQTKCQIKGFDKSSISKGAAPQWNNHLFTEQCHVLFVELPAGWVGEWHENPEPQWIIPLSGSWWVETMDGERVVMGPGEFSFGADQNTTDQKGHRSGTEGDEPCRMMIVQIKDPAYRAALPGIFEFLGEEGPTAQEEE